MWEPWESLWGGGGEYKAVGLPSRCKSLHKGRDLHGILLHFAFGSARQLGWALVDGSHSLESKMVGQQKGWEGAEKVELRGTRGVPERRSCGVEDSEGGRCLVSFAQRGLHPALT